MDKELFHRQFDLFDESLMCDLVVPLYCVNKCCVNWSSPSYCFKRYLIGLQHHPVCIRSAVLANLKLIGLKSQPIQLKFEFD